MSIKEEGNMKDPEMQQQMELQLHEQYSINNNSNLSSAMVLFVAMLAVVGAYGYVYIHSVNEFSYDCISFVNDKGLYYLDAVMIAAVATIFVLGIIIYLCISFGCRQRREQFVIDAIRKKYYTEEGYKNIFPHWYNPKNKKGLENVQSPYDGFVYCANWTIRFIYASLLLKVIIVCNCYPKVLVSFLLFGGVTMIVYTFFYEKTLLKEVQKITGDKSDNKEIDSTKDKSKLEEEEKDVVNTK